MNAAERGDWLDSPTGELTPDELTFLGKEYDHLVSSLLANEESGEKRVSLFLTFVGVGSIALSIVAESAGGSMGDAGWAVALIATLVLLVGLMTLQRTISRNLHTDELINGLGRIRGFFSFFRCATPGIATTTYKVTTTSSVARRSRACWIGHRRRRRDELLPLAEVARPLTSELLVDRLAHMPGPLDQLCNRNPLELEELLLALIGCERKG